jgi:hypothetical protein
MKSPVSSYPAKSKSGGTPYSPSIGVGTKINPSSGRHKAPRVINGGSGTKKTI